MLIPVTVYTVKHSTRPASRDSDGRPVFVTYCMCVYIPIAFLHILVPRGFGVHAGSPAMDAPISSSG